MTILQHITAVPLAGGNRIGLRWLNPSPEVYGGVKVVRRALTHPTAPTDGRTVVPGDIAGEIVPNNYLFSLDVSFSHYLDNAFVSPGLAGAFSTHGFAVSRGAGVTVITPGFKWTIEDGGEVYLAAAMDGRLNVYGPASVEDAGLQAETVYYYTLFPYNAGEDDHAYHFKNRASAMAGGNYDSTGLMYGLLPAVYHRYDSFMTSGREDGKGPLRRFLELPGEQLDLFYSYVRAAGDLHNPDRTDGRLLPLLAHWIGWETDPDKEIEKQRIELRNANALYRAIGSIPTLETMVKQVTGWENRVKEFRQGLFFSNRPEELYQRAYHRGVTEDGGIVLEEEADIVSADHARDGRPSAVWVRGEEDVLWLFYHTQRKGGWNIWLKTYTVNDGWSPSRPFTFTGPAALDKYPSAAFQEFDGNEKLWVFRCAYDPQTHAPSIRFRVRTGGLWSEDTVFDHGNANGNKRTRPFAVTEKRIDENGVRRHRLWLFWLEGGGVPGVPGRLKYNRHDGTGWESETPVDFPLDGEYDPRVDEDFFVLVHPFKEDEDAENRVTVLWTRKARVDGGGAGHMRHLSRKEVVYRQKTGFDNLADGWGPVHTLPETGGDIYDDREPAAVVDGDGGIHLCWSTNRDGSWSVRHIAGPDIFDLSGPGLTARVTGAEPVLDSLYSQRAPLPVTRAGEGKGVTVLFRSSRGPVGENATSSRMAAMDFLSAGSLSVDDRISSRLGRRNDYDDLINYTYDTGLPGPDSGPRVLGSGNRYTHDSVGLFIRPTAEDTRMLNRGQEMILGILDRFVPILVRVVFIIALPGFEDYVYPYYVGDTEKDIDDDFADTLEVLSPTETYPVATTDSMDRALLDWVWLNSWSGAFTAHHSVDTRAVPAITRYRSVHTGVDPVVEEGMYAGSVPEKYPGFTDTTAGSIDYFPMDSWSTAYPDHLSVDTGAVPVNKNNRTLHTGLTFDPGINMRVWTLPDRYGGVSDGITDTVTGGNETKSWYPGAVDFSYTVDFSGTLPENTLTSWHEGYT